MDWKKIYSERVMGAEEAVAKIRSGDAIIPTHAAGEPRFLIGKLMERADELEGVEIWQGLNQGDAPYAREEYAGKFINISFFLGRNNRKCIQSGQGEFLPIHFYAQPRAIREGKIRCDVAMIHCTPPDENGYVNMGLSCDQTRVAVETAKLTIAQVNSLLPHVNGDTQLHVSEIDCFVEHDEEPYEIPLIAGDDPVSEQIGYNISTLIDDGDTLQMGQGKIPNAILKYLADKKDLGIHTEVFSDNLIPLIEAGIVNGAKKTINKRKIIATFVQGTKDLYRYIDRNDMICLKPVDYTNDVAIIAQNDHMVAINSAIEVDLMGQVVADSIGRKTFSGVGGQLDFLRGAEQSKGGKPIIALPATAKGGTISRIVAVLAPGTPVTTSRQDVHYIVTEYGIADLFGAPIRARAKKLIEIAAPQFRAGLEEDFHNYYRSIDA
ncbi:MAG: 4-hydroxybutyrate CoA-transferase [Clostridiales Family XIII bacterium]|jgi:4-hydroxybutyrate CoA-transferase|nr:4-hydroxybutyrate CoA-transferase [Clostridiales Family XIII bacterium]